MRLAMSASETPSRNFFASSSSVVSADQLSEDLSVEAARSRLIGSNRPAGLTSQLLKAVVVELTELFNGNLGVAYCGYGVPAESAEDVANAPDRETDDKKAHDNSHDGFAEPGRRSFVNTAEHARGCRYNVGLRG